MRINEIERMRANDYTYDKDDMPKLGFAMIDNGKPLRGNSGWYYSVTPNKYDPKDLVVNVYDLKNNVVLGNLNLYREKNFAGLSNCFSVGSIGVDPDYRGRGIAKILYGISLLPPPKGLGVTLLSGDGQTPGGRANWKSLSTTPGYDVTGYIGLDIDTVDTLPKGVKLLEKITAMGGVYLGKSASTYSYIFEFQVVAKAKEMANAIAGTFKVYNRAMLASDAPYQSGMIARYIG